MKDFVKQDNLRALPKFLALVAGFTVLGGIGGFLAAIAAKPETLEAIRAGMDPSDEYGRSLGDPGKRCGAAVSCMAVLPFGPQAVWELGF